VCFAVDAPYAGGAERYVSLLASGIDRGVFEPLVLAGTGAGLDAWCERVAGCRVEVVRVPMEMPFHPEHAVSVLSALLAMAPHVVHVNMPGPYSGQMGLLAPLSRIAGSARVVVTEHLPRVERLWKRALVKNVSYAWVDRVLTVCRSNLPFLVDRQRVAEHKIGVVYNGIRATYGSRREKRRESARRELGLDELTTGIVFVGSLIERKGVGVLLDALSGLDPDGWRLFVIGTGDEQTAYEGAVTRMALENSVRFLGGVSEDQVEQVLCASDLLVLPSFMEGMPYVILEAMACSLPVVATRIDGIPEAAPDGEAALLVPPGDAQALRSAIGRLVGDGVLRKTLGENGRRRFEQMFTLDRHIEQMESVYIDLLTGGG
jgi:glycosyltransferase involved in cell wall biosynthesis